jgi:hypothetical protein
MTDILPWSANRYVSWLRLQVSKWAIVVYILLSNVTAISWREQVNF